MALTLGMITTDSADPVPLAAWWAKQFDAEVADPYGGEFLLVRGGTLPLALAFQKVDDPTPGKNRLHLDLGAPDVDAEVERLVAGGATIVGRRGEEGFSWVTLKDPAGNEFCIAAADEAAAEL
ncbi:VOC family protein [Nocardioides sp. LHD-245]|uniref:VOC family protein n=1 Tax=Nocardioides sp. LHD-245 TaxID=3051387 RepID=UPI0027DF533B|nr:VOC family protein [Nocardioides sp. LHD-245]